MRMFSLLFVVLLLLGGCLGQNDFQSENQSSNIWPTTAEALLQLDTENLNELARYEGKWASVRGKIHSSHLANSEKVLTLNLGSNWQRWFKIAIFPDAFEKWGGGISSIKSLYEGRMVAVEGALRMYQGNPELTVRVPS
jgi:hypothetical protein